MALFLLVFLLGLSAGAVASFVGAAAGPTACDVFVFGVAAGCLVVRPGEAARVPAFPPGPAFAFALLSLTAMAAAVGLPLVVAALPVVAAGVAGGRVAQAALFHLGVQGVPRRGVAGALVAGVAVAPALVVAAASQSVGLAAALAGAPPLAFALAVRGPRARTFDLPRPRPEPPLANVPTLLAVVLVGAGFSRLVGDAPLPLLAAAGGALVAGVVLPRARRSGVVLGTTALLAVGLLGLLLDRAPSSPWLADGDLRAAAVAALLGFGVTGLPRLYATLPPASKVIAKIDALERPVHDGAVRRVALFLVGVVLGRAPWLERAAPWVVFAVLAAGGAALIWFDPRAGIGRRVKVLAVAGGVALAGLWLVRGIG